RGVQPRAPLRRRAAEARPEIQALRARQRGVEDEHRKKIGVQRRRRMPRKLEVRRGPFPLDENPALSALSWLRRATPLGRLRRRNPAEMRLRAPQYIIRLDIADHHERGIAGYVVPTVVAEQIVPRHRTQILEPANRRMAIWMRAKRRCRHLGIEQLIGIV